MKKLITYLESLGIQEESHNPEIATYKVNKYGNPYYFNDGFSVEGVTVHFCYDLASREDFQKLDKMRKDVESYIKAHKAVCIHTSGKTGIFEPYITIMQTFDKRRLEEHTQRIKEATEAFWIEEHARREAQKGETA